MQHRLAGNAEDRSGLIKADPAVGDLGDDAVTDSLVDPDAPGRARGELLAGEASVVRLPEDGDLADAQEALGLGDGHHDDLLAAGDEWLGGRLAVGDAGGELCWLC